VNLASDFTRTGGALQRKNLAVGPGIFPFSVSARWAATSQSIGGDSGSASPHVTSILVELAEMAVGLAGVSGALGAVRKTGDQSEGRPTPAQLRAQTRNLYRLSG
jgi:hypothetical protein